MIKHFSYLLLVIILHLPIPLLKAQKTEFYKKVKFGIIPQSSFSLNTYQKDPDAEALVLFDIGESYFDFRNITDIIHKRHRRIKILKKEGYDLANISIPIYKKGEVLEKLEAISITRNKLGNITRRIITPKEVYEEKLSKRWKLVKFAFPNVKVGSIIEYRYTIKSRFDVNLRSWQFQSSIPTLWSEYKVNIPSYYNFVRIFQGLTNFHKRSVTNNYVGISGGQVKAENLHWAMKDIPAFVTEKYMTNPDNFIAKVEFQLKSVNFPNQPPNTFFSSWTELEDELLSDSRFGEQIQKDNFGDEIINTVKKLKLNSLDGAKAIYKYVQYKMTWNKSKRLLANNITKTFRKGQGSSADINLALVSLLKRAGLYACPVILSTRDHEQINRFYPLINKFNYTVAYVSIQGKDYLIDATQKTLPFGLLPYRCLNGYGRIVRTDLRGKNNWIKLYNGTKLNESVNVLLKLDENGKLEGKLNIVERGYAAVFSRAISLEGKNNEKIKVDQKTKEKLKGLKVKSFEQQNLTKLNKPYQRNYEISIDEQSLVAGNRIYFNPLLYWKEDDNPFKLKHRIYPIDFGYKYNLYYYLNLKIPANYIVESLPKERLVLLPNEHGKFAYSVKQINNQELIIVSRFNINKPIFNSEEYKILKEFYAQIIDKQSEQIVLKRK